MVGASPPGDERQRRPRAADVIRLFDREAIDDVAGDDPRIGEYLHRMADRYYRSILDPDVSLDEDDVRTLDENLADVYDFLLDEERERQWRLRAKVVDARREADLEFDELSDVERELSELDRRALHRYREYHEELAEREDADRDSGSDSGSGDADGGVDTR